MSDLAQVEREAFSLSSSDRAVLASRLLASLDDREASETEASESEALWLEEARRRYEACQAGRISARSSEDVLREAMARFR